jgi:hypothetical protein
MKAKLRPILKAYNYLKSSAFEFRVYAMAGKRPCGWLFDKHRKVP